MQLVKLHCPPFWLTKIDDPMPLSLLVVVFVPMCTCTVALNPQISSKHAKENKVRTVTKEILEFSNMQGCHVRTC